MKLPLLQAQQHTNIGRLLAILLLQPANILNILELSLREAFVVFATEAAKDETGVGVAADFDEPAGGFRHPPDDT